MVEFPLLVSDFSVLSKWNIRSCKNSDYSRKFRCRRSRIKGISTKCRFNPILNIVLFELR
jgi:hypothetical protein